VARWPTSLVAVLALVAAGCGQASGEPRSSQPQSSAGQPRVVPVSKNPLKMKGTGFVPGERVHVELVGNESRTVTASSTGSFSVTFPSDRCTSVTVRATGSKGSRTSFNLSQPLCVEQ
jgi:hypothetical protein